MRARLVLWLSLGLNLLLAGMIVILSRDSQKQASLDFPSISTNGKSLPKQVRTNVIIRRQGFQWSQIESPDYPTFIRNLRLIGCPEKTIHDIIVADINEVFAERITKEVVLPEQQWWLAEPNTDVFASAASQIRALEAEKNQLLTQLLGPNWNTTPQTGKVDPIRLDGPVLSKLSPDTKAKLFDIEANSRRAREAYLRQMQEAGKEPDPVQLARLRQQTRLDLATLLTPDQYEEYLLRYSSTSGQLRQQLRGFGADADEYRKIFRARDAFDEQLAALSGNDAATQKRRTELERQRDEAVRQAIGSERFPLYQLTQNPLFKQAQESAEDNNAPPEKVLPIYQVNQAAQQEITRLQNDRTLTDEARAAALKLVQEQQQASIQKIISGQVAQQ
jgi:hypothetical protein